MRHNLRDPQQGVSSDLRPKAALVRNWGPWPEQASHPPAPRPGHHRARARQAGGQVTTEEPPSLVGGQAIYWHCETGSRTEGGATQEAEGRRGGEMGPGRSQRRLRAGRAGPVLWGWQCREAPGPSSRCCHILTIICPIQSLHNLFSAATGPRTQKGNSSITAVFLPNTFWISDKCWPQNIQ